MSTNNNQNININSRYRLRSDPNGGYNLRSKRAIPRKVCHQPEEKLPKHFSVREAELHLEDYDPFIGEGFKGYIWNVTRPKWVKEGYNLVLANDVEQVPCNDTEKKITDITFSVNRWGKCQHTLHFNKPLTEKEAILKVTEWLLKPMSHQYYNKLDPDYLSILYGCWLPTWYTWDYFKGKSRGAALGNVISIRKLDYGSDVNSSKCVIICDLVKK